MEFLKDNIDHIIFAILGLMSFLSVWFSCERLIFFIRLDSKDYPNEEVLEEALSKNLTALYIIYSNAPYVGLLGTVIFVLCGCSTCLIASSWAPWTLDKK